MEILLLIVGLVIGYLVGEFYCLYRMRHIIMGVAAKEGIYLDEEIEDRVKVIEVHKLRIQNINDMLYLYTDAEDFICQAKTLEELASLSQQYKNIKYAAVIHDDKVFTFINGNVTEKE